LQRRRRSCCCLVIAVVVVASLLLVAVVADGTAAAHGDGNVVVDAGDTISRRCGARIFMEEAEVEDEEDLATARAALVLWADEEEEVERAPRQLELVTVRIVRTAALPVAAVAVAAAVLAVVAIIMISTVAAGAVCAAASNRQAWLIHSLLELALRCY